MSSNGLYAYGSSTSSSSSNNNTGVGKNSIPGFGSRTLKGVSGSTNNSLRSSQIGTSDYRAALQSQQQNSNPLHAPSN